HQEVRPHHVRPLRGRHPADRGLRERHPRHPVPEVRSPGHPRPRVVLDPGGGAPPGHDPVPARDDLLHHQMSGFAIVLFVYIALGMGRLGYILYGRMSKDVEQWNAALFRTVAEAGPAAMAIGMLMEIALWPYGLYLGVRIVRKLARERRERIARRESYLVAPPPEVETSSEFLTLSDQAPMTPELRREIQEKL